MSLFKNLKFTFLLALTLGLAPFFPEPHIWQKLKLIIGGSAGGFDLMDWWDVIIHGTPWLLFLRALYFKLLK